MEGIRQKIKRTGNKLIIDLPEDFKSEIIELIIFPADEISEDQNLQLSEWRNFSIRNLDHFYSIDEPDYADAPAKEANKKYKT